MKLFPQDDDFPLYEKGFDIDLLGRKKLSKQLSDLIERLENPTVFALDDKWGSGKSYFLKRWVYAHQNENNGTATTVYFDAFANDYISDPLLSLVSALIERLPKEQKSLVEKIKKVAVGLGRPALNLGLVLATLGAKQHLDDIGDAVAEALKSEVENAADKIWEAEANRKEAFNQFKQYLIELTNDGQKPVVVVVDELDRCRPDYALSVLEIIKHFFAVPKVHFVLGINGDALENSIKARYGSGIDAASYLKKFIQVTFSLPRESNCDRPGQHLVEYSQKLIKSLGIRGDISNRCVQLLKCISSGRDVSLRDIGKIMSSIALLPNEVRDGSWTHGEIDLIAALIVVSVIDEKLHKQLLTCSVSNDTIRDFLNAPTKVTLKNQSSRFDTDFYDHEKAKWTSTFIFYFGEEELSEAVGLPESLCNPDIRVDIYGFRLENRKMIATRMQREWIDIFKI